MIRRAFAWLSRYERHLSAAAMIGGFLADNVLFGRIDIQRTQIIFAAYTAACVFSIGLLHWIESRAQAGKPRPFWRGVLPIITQFALGGFWSGFVIFYGRSAVISADWPFLLVLFLVFLGNEYFKKYHERLVFTSTLFFFALYSYAIFDVPIFVGTLGTWVFLLSGVIAVAVFTLFLGLLYMLGKRRFRTDARRIAYGVAGVLIVINVSYFTSILPPLPLAARGAGIYHYVGKVSGGYEATWEAQPWYVRYLGFEPVEHIVQDESLYAYSAVFAPTSITTTIIHQWQWYNPNTGRWETQAAVPYTIKGGRDGGYRGYTAMLITKSGEWRVNIRAQNGLLIARLPFRVVQTQLPPAETTGLLEK